VSVLLTLSRTDSQPGGEIIREFEVEEFVQTTFEQLRVGPEGDVIGYFEDGVWRLLDEQPDRWYTDLTVSAVPS
jgi:hypothetical protein